MNSNTDLSPRAQQAAAEIMSIVNENQPTIKDLVASYKRLSAAGGHYSNWEFTKD